MQRIVLSGGSQVAGSPSPFDSLTDPLTDLNRGAGPDAPGESDSAACMGIRVCSGHDEAPVRSGTDGDRIEVAPEDVVAGVAAIVIVRDRPREPCQA